MTGAPSAPVVADALPPDLTTWARLLQQLAAGEHDVAVAAPGSGPGYWAGAASAIRVGSVTYLAYRLRRPVDAGRGYAAVVARSEDGVAFETLAEVRREDVGAESLERPALVHLDGGGWRLYLSCATAGSKHWWLQSLTAARAVGLPTGRPERVEVLDPATAAKDPVILRDKQGGWHMWVCAHPLDVPGAEDRMTTRYATSADGLRWGDHGEVLRGRPGRWDARGARVTTVLGAVGNGLGETAGLPGRSARAVLYDGRPDAASNWCESTGIAVANGGPLAPLDGGPLRSSDSDGALRYASAVVTLDGGKRLYAERARPDGAHDLVTVST